MSAFASSSTTSMVRNFGRSARGGTGFALTHMLRARPMASTPLSATVLSPRVSTPIRALSGSSISANTIPAARAPSLRSLIKHLDPLLPGSPTSYLLRRALTTSSALRSPSSLPATTTTPAPRTSQPDPDPAAEENDSEPDPNLSAYARLKILFKRYGWYALGMYMVLSALDFSLVFVLIHLAGAERIEPLLNGAVGQYRRLRYGKEVAAEMAEEVRREAEIEKKKVEAEEKGVKKKKKEKSGWMSRTVLAELALAYPIHKVALLPVRAGLTVAWTPKFVGWLTRRGWVGKGGYTRAASHAGDKLRTAKDRVKERVQDLKP